ncbi:MAG: MMPL family transporter [Clostridia bacterium]|nr:MMPL family transporter [Clostridia bacterium]
MQKLSQWIMSHRKTLIIIFVVAIVLSIVGTLFVQKESDLISYLDKDTDTIVSKKILENEYGIIGDCNLAISYVDKDTVQKIVDAISNDSTIKKYLTKIAWVGTFDQLDEINENTALGLPQNRVDTEEAQKKAAEKFVKTKTVRFKTTIDGVEQEIERSVDTYIVSLYFETAGGSDETIACLDRMDEIIPEVLKNVQTENPTLGPDSVEEWYYIGGNAQNARTLLKSSLGDMPKFFIVAVAVCLVILMLTTQSWLEPFIFLATLGISILLNMGTNIIAGNPMGRISSITSSCATILQLAIAMDYSIFLMHTYYEELKIHPRPQDALTAALPKTITAISSSMLTTVGGFIALFFMDYGIGYDLGFVLAKGVILSLLSTVFLQPILIMILSKGIAKTKHKWVVAPKLKFVSKNITKPVVAAIVIVIVLGLALPCAYFQLKVPLNYISTTKDNPNPTLPEETAMLVNNQAILILPYDGADSMPNHYEFIEKVKKVGYELDSDGNIKYDENGKAVVSKDVNYVTEVFSLATIITQDDFDNIESTIAPSLKGVVYNQLHGSFIANINSTSSTKNKYILYTITLSNQDENGSFANMIETEYTYSALKEIKYLAVETFGLYKNSEETQTAFLNLTNIKNEHGSSSEQYLSALADYKESVMNNAKDYNVYVTGLAQGAYELDRVTPNDFLLVTLLSAAIVLIILLFTFKNVKLSIILMLVIESGIWINLSFVYFASVFNPANKINFVAYLIVTAIELGATVDYAIMLTTKYLEEKKDGVKSIAAVKNAINRAAPGVTTSAFILIGVCACVHLITTNMIVAQITRLLAIGTSMSYVFVFTLLPAILSFDERLKRRLSIKKGKGDPDVGRFDYNPNYYNEDGTPISEETVPVVENVSELAYAAEGESQIDDAQEQNATSDIVTGEKKEVVIDDNSTVE